MEVKKVKLSALKLNDGNPRIIKDFKFQKLVKSLLTFPEMLKLREVVCDETMLILGGNMRCRALMHIAQMTEQELKQELKKIDRDEYTDQWMRWHDCPMIDVKIAEGLSDEQKKEFIVKDNVGYGEWDWDMLANEWDMEDLKDWGVDVPIDWGNEIESENADLNAEEDDFDEDKDAVEPICQRGDIWMLGQHTLMCGDSTSEEEVSKLMDGKCADICFSSPPYNAGTTATESAMGKKTKYNGNDGNKSQEDYVKFLNQYIKCALKNSSYTFVNVQSISNNKIALIEVLYKNKEKYADTIIWDKIHGQPAMAENVMNSVFEYVHIFSEKANRAIGTIKFRGTIDNIIHLSSQRKNEYSKIHNATFSVEFASYFVKNFAKNSVLDLFGGTGTTLIACEQLDRKCYMMELDPHYCDVIIARWEKLTGNKAIKKQ